MCRNSLTNVLFPQFLNADIFFRIFQHYLQQEKTKITTIINLHKKSINYHPTNRIKTMRFLCTNYKNFYDWNIQNIYQ